MKTRQQSLSPVGKLQRNVKRNTFTLIELLVVIAIIAILAGMLLPALSSVKGAGASADCKSRIKNLYLASFMYVNDCNGWFPGNYTQYTQMYDQVYGIGQYIGLKSNSHAGSPNGRKIMRHTFGCAAVKDDTWFYKSSLGSDSNYKLRCISHISGNNSYLPRNLNEFGKPNNKNAKGECLAPSPSKCFYWSDAGDCTSVDGRGCFVYGWNQTWTCLYVPASGAGYTAFRHNKQMNFCTLSGDVRQAKGWYKMPEAAFWANLGLRKQDNWKVGRVSDWSLERAGAQIWY